LPVNEEDSLIYCHNKKDPQEMFAPLLEKVRKDDKIYL